MENAYDDESADSQREAKQMICFKKFHNSIVNGSTNRDKDSNKIATREKSVKKDEGHRIMKCNVPHH
jgi:hypothetical protein